MKTGPAPQTGPAVQRPIVRGRSGTNLLSLLNIPDKWKDLSVTNVGQCVTLPHTGPSFLARDHEQ